MVVRPDVEIAATNMDPIEQRIVPELCEWRRARPAAVRAVVDEM